jgi:hypothetical protein
MESIIEHFAKFLVFYIQYFLSNQSSATVEIIKRKNQSELCENESISFAYPTTKNFIVDFSGACYLIAFIIMIIRI